MPSNAPWYIPDCHEKSSFLLKRVMVASGSLREFQPGLMLDNVEDLVDWKVQGVKVMEPSAFAVVGGACSLEARARCPLARFLELSC